VSLAAVASGVADREAIDHGPDCERDFVEQLKDFAAAVSLKLSSSEVETLNCGQRLLNCGLCGRRLISAHKIDWSGGWMHGTTMPYMTGRMLIGGELVESKSGQWLESINPADENRARARADGFGRRHGGCRSQRRKERNPHGRRSRCRSAPNTSTSSATRS
jgi:hypothetical protein